MSEGVTRNPSLSVPRVIQKVPGPSKSPRNRDHHWNVASSGLQVLSQCANRRKCCVGGCVGGKQSNTNTENPRICNASDRLRWWISAMRSPPTELGDKGRIQEVITYRRPVSICMYSNRHKSSCTYAWSQ